MSRSLEVLLRHDRLVVLAALLTLTAVCWVYVFAGAGTGMPAIEMSALPTATNVTGHMAFMEPAQWTAGYAALMLWMWWVMMVAMMLPSAAPAILLFAAIDRQRQTGQAPYAPTVVFTAGYLTIWALFSVGATALQWLLEKVALMSPLMVTTSTILGGALLIAAGIWQFTPLKDACLRHCRSPADVITRWRGSGPFGPFYTGIMHGTFCLGCCWVLMLLLFYGGVMNVYWIAGLALLVLIEKIFPAGVWLSRAIGGALIVWGTAIIANYL